MAYALRLRCWKGEWQYDPVGIDWRIATDRYIVVSSWVKVAEYEDAFTDDVKSKLAMLQVSPKGTHIEGVGFRSDYEGDDLQIEPFFYVVI